MPCMQSEFEWIIETYGDRSLEYCEYVAGTGPRRVCSTLPEGHDGEHEWTPTDEVALRVRER